MAWIFCSSGQAVIKAGRLAPSITASGSVLGPWSDEVEDTICSLTRSNLITNYSSLTTNGKKMLQSLSSSMIAQKIIGYDLSAYNSTREAETMLDILENEIQKILKKLDTDDNVKRYLGA